MSVKFTWSYFKNEVSPFLISLTLHLSCLLLVLLMQPTGSGNGEGGKSEKEGKGQNVANGELIPKQVEVEIIEIPPPPEEKAEVVAPKPPPEPPKPVEGITECEGTNWYGGIGIQQDFYTGKLELVNPGDPADKAGLKVGDFISAEGKDIRGEPGTEIRLLVYREPTKEQFYVNITRSKICTKERKRP